MKRLLSLDVFRGMTIAGMILVNNPGNWDAIYHPLDHAEWHGWTPTDLIFPFFLFIVGVAIPFSFARFLEGGDRKGLTARIARRTLLIFACGLFLHFFMKWDFATLRIPGVLQRIAVCYGIASILTLRLSLKGIVRCAVLTLAGYWLLLEFVHAPSFARSGAEVRFEDVSADQRPDFLSKEGSLPSYVDRQVFGRHTWKPEYDPEGLLSTIPAIATTLLGVLTGFWLRSGRPREQIALGLFTAGCLAACAGYAWSALLPINKALWTSSYVLLTGGIAMLFLGFCYWVVDGLGRTMWCKPFEVYGMNALAVFMASGLLGRVLPKIHVDDLNLRQWIYKYGFETWLDGKNASLAFALANVLFWLAILWILYWRKIFIKL